MKKILISISLILLITILAFAFRGKRHKAISESDQMVVKQGDVIARATETGELVPMNAVEIKSEQAGEVKKFFVQAGDRVKPGQLLATLRPELNQVQKVAEARARVSQAKLTWEEAEREHQRMDALFAKGFIAQKELEAIEGSKENAKIQHALAQKQLLLTLGSNKVLYQKVLQMDLTTEAMDDFSVFSPISGTVIEVSVSEGQIVSSGMSAVTSGTTLMKISDLSKMWIKTKINEVNIGQIREGQKSEIKLDAIPNQVYHGKVLRISPKGEKTDNVIRYEVTIEIANPDQRLMPSMTANVDIITATEKNALYLPLIALTQYEGSDAVILPGKGHQKKKQYQRITLGLRNETVAVIQKGLAIGDKVLLPKKEEKEEE
ncbi:MAG: efflux RND transporter periplasmic adaptor subunit [Nitrospirota bacterium]